MTEKTKRKNSLYNGIDFQTFHQYIFWATVGLLIGIFLIWDYSHAYAPGAYSQNLLNGFAHLSWQFVLMLICTIGILFAATRAFAAMFASFTAPDRYWRYVVTAAILSVVACCVLGLLVWFVGAGVVILILIFAI